MNLKDWNHSFSTAEIVKREYEPNRGKYGTSKQSKVKKERLKHENKWLKCKNKREEERLEHKTKNEKEFVKCEKKL